MRQTLKLTLLLFFCGCLLPHPVGAADSIETAGDVLALSIPVIAYGGTFCQHDDEGRWQFYQSFFTNAAVTFGLKYTVDEKRPNGKKHSFPSGHTSASFQGAAFVHKRYGLEYALPMYLGAAFVGYSRVESDNHHPVDVLAGAVIGTLSSFYFTTPRGDLMVTPSAENGVYGITISKTW